MPSRLKICTRIYFQSPSPCPRCLRRGSTAARLLGIRIRIPPRVWMSVSCHCCVMSGRGLCVGLINRPEESYRVWCVSDREASIMKRPWPTRGSCAMGGKKLIFRFPSFESYLLAGFDLPIYSTFEVQIFCTVHTDITGCLESR
jgi:hypothetical protein